MPLFDEEPAKKKPVPHTLGEDLASLSIAELEERIGLLKAEVGRLEDSIRGKKLSAEAASSFFKK
jgi:uncharacterized small protein (DUF1192 family)